MVNSEYWANRMKILNESLLDTGYEYVKNFETQYDEAVRTIDKEMRVWYQRFAKNNEITLAEAKKLLNSNELEEFRWTVVDYIKNGKSNALSGEWMKQLENASARVHISRLESLKLQLRQEAERLYSSQLKDSERLLDDIYREGYYHTAFEVQKGLGFGWNLQSLNAGTLQKVLSRPWTTDGQTFRDRVWTNKKALVESVNKNLTQMIMRGEAPDRAIKEISKQFNVSKNKAGRLVMTESAAFSSASRQDCFTELGVEQYKIIVTLDNETCELCSEIDSKVYRMTDYVVGSTAPPFHPWCRCCTAPYFDDMEGLGARAAKDSEGKTYTVPKEMNYSSWLSYNKAIAHELKITATMQDIVATVGGELSGLEYRLKTPESYTRKINKDAKEYIEGHPHATYEASYIYATGHMYDTVRYTILSNSDEFTSNFNKTVYNLKKKGYNMNRVKNSLPNMNASYRGVNTVVTTPDGYNFELQFHTPESLVVKNKTHMLYEEQRKISTSTEHRSELDRQMQELTQSILTPKDAETIIPFNNL